MFSKLSMYSTSIDKPIRCSANYLCILYSISIVKPIRYFQYNPMIGSVLVNLFCTI